MTLAQLTYHLFKLARGLPSPSAGLLLTLLWIIESFILDTFYTDKPH